MNNHTVSDRHGGIKTFERKDIVTKWTQQYLQMQMHEDMHTKDKILNMVLWIWQILNIQDTDNHGYDVTCSMKL